jgi:2-oxoglutarate dehydrogenase E2 component (dihydrolipoamide succinyltransferase)
MSLEVKIPTVGESISEVTISGILKKEGEFVNQDEILCELESDKATFELTSPSAGVVKWKAGQGDTVSIGATVCLIETEAAKIQAPPAAPAAGGSAAAASIFEIKIPAVGESINEVTLANWTKKNGDLVNQGELLCEIESDKATFELTAETSGYLRILVEKGSTVAIGTIVGTIASSSAASPSAPAVQAPQPESPVAQVAGSGEGGKITKDDALKAKPGAAVPPAVPVVSAPQASGLSFATSGNRPEKREKMSSLRKTVARRLVAVKNETAMLTTFNEVDMKPIMDLRNRYKDKFKEKHEVGLGFMSFFTKAVCTALLEYPGVNASIDGEEIVFHDYADISIAVSAPKGLVVPVIRNAESMSFAEIEKEIVRLAGKARDNKLSIEEMTGGTFTITNGGIFGSMMSTPIINSPQSAILGMHNIVERPMAVNGEIVIRPMMYLALSYDHRIIDGRESVGFLVRVKQLLEDPMRLLLEV